MCVSAMRGFNLLSRASGSPFCSCCSVCGVLSAQKFGVTVLAVNGSGCFLRLWPAAYQHSQDLHLQGRWKLEAGFLWNDHPSTLHCGFQSGPGDANPYRDHCSCCPQPVWVCVQDFTLQDVRLDPVSFTPVFVLHSLQHDLSPLPPHPFGSGERCCHLHSNTSWDCEPNLQRNSNKA